MKVYKYQGGCFQRDLSSLEKDEFYASSRGQLNDPFEVMFHKKGIENDLDAYSGRT